MAIKNPLAPTPRTASGQSRISVLLVAADDRELMSMAVPFEASQWAVRFAKSGTEAHAEVSAKDVPLVIIDGDAQATCWKELLEQWPLSEDGNMPKFVVAFRKADGRLWAEVLNLGGYDLLTKPLDAGEVAWVAQTALAEQNGTKDRALRDGFKECPAWNRC